MYRVVTKTMRMDGEQWRATIEPGPWQPEENSVKRWADYLKSTGLYYAVLIESSMENRSQQRIYS